MQHHPVAGSQIELLKQRAAKLDKETTPKEAEKTIEGWFRAGGGRAVALKLGYRLEDLW